MQIKTVISSSCVCVSVCGKIGLTFFFSLVLFALADVSSELKFPRQRLTKRKASKQFEAAKCADGTMSPLIESGRDLCISREGVGAVCRFPICAFTRRLCAQGLCGRTPVCKSFQTPRRGKTAAWKSPPFAYVPEGYENIGRY